ncbi:recombinase family protein [bacterium]|nr:recombinase family protein [bacterium]
MKAVGYIRVSTSEQAKEGVSLDNQTAKIKAYSDLNDFILIDIIKDAGLSGKNLKRPGINKLMKMIKKKEIDTIIVYKLDRLSRKVKDTLELIESFDKKGITFHSITEKIDTKSAMGKFFLNITASLAQMERDLISERTTDALKYKKSKMEKTGGDIPFGFDVTEENILIKNSDEQKVISLIRRSRKKGASLRAICRKLEEKGFRTKRGCLNWHPETISNILKRTA